MIVYKIDVLAALSRAGYTSYRLRNEHIIGEFTLQKIREGGPITWNTLGKLCDMLHCQPGDLIENVPG